MEKCTKWILVLCLTVVEISILFFFVQAVMGWESDNYSIDGNDVFVNDSKVYIKASPHTIYKSGWVEFELYSKKYSGDIDVVFGFDTDYLRPSNPQLYSPYLEYWNLTHSLYVENVTSISTTSENCDHGYSYNNYKRKVNYTFEYINEDNETVNENYTKVFCFDSYVQNGDDYTIVWNQTKNINILWKDISGSFDSVNHEYGDMDKWWYIKGANINANQTYKIRAYIQLLDSFMDKKYWFALKPSSETVQQSIQNNHFYALDPWVDSTFTPSLSKRNTTSPFDSGVMIQGDSNNADGLTDDIVSFSRGNQIEGNFYNNMDSEQGSIVLWFTPEYSFDSLSGTGDHYLFYMEDNYFLSYEYDNDRYNITIGGQSFTVDSSIQSGTNYNLVLRWDTRNTLDGINYASLSIDDSTNMGISSQPTNTTTSSTIYIGSDGSDNGLSGIVQGFTIYRRSLFDGINGTNVTGVDEVNDIYNSGSGENPMMTTGSWDIVFSLTSNSTVGELSTGTGHAWSHPHSSNNLTDGYMATNYSSSGWSDFGTPTSVINQSNSSRIFSGGYNFTVDSSNEGIYQDLTVSAGEDYVFRGLAHSDGTSIPIVVIYDESNSEEITYENGTSSSNRTQPHNFYFTFEVPSGSSNISIQILNNHSSGTVYIHQAELLKNDNFVKINDTSLDGLLVTDNMFGTSIENIGDLDGDGIQDLAVGAQKDDDGSGSNAGAVWILFMFSNGTVKSYKKINDNSVGGGLDGEDRFGADAENIGDLDGDGIQDLAVGSYLDDDGGTNTGAVWILYMNTDGTVDSYAKINDTSVGGGLDGNDQFGLAVENIGDLDGDGIVDLAVGAYGDDDGTGDNAGAVWILYMFSNGTVKSYEKINDNSVGGGLDDGDAFGIGITEIGDLDGDGIVDLAVGASKDDDGTGSDAGAVWILFMFSNGTVKSYEKINDNSVGGGLDGSDWFGRNCENIGDLDGDGIQDLAVGSYIDDDGGTDAGAVWVLFIFSNGTVKDYIKINDTSVGGELDGDDQFGISIVNMGDLNGDGVVDLAVGAQKDDDGGSDAGAVWVLFMGHAYMDNPYFFDYDEVSLTVTPSSKTNSGETSGLRVDGLDTSIENITGWDNVTGTMEFNITPRHNYSQSDLFGYEQPVIAEFYYNQSNFIKIYRENDTTLTVQGNFSGTLIQANWTDPVLENQTTYTFNISYSNETGFMNLTVDDVEKASQSGVPSTGFEETPNITYWGSNSSGLNQYDLTFNSTQGSNTTTSGDTTSPQWQDISEGSSDPSTYTFSPNYGFQINCTDETGMFNAIFTHNNSGSFSNTTCSNDTADIFYANITSMGAVVLNYSFVCNDTSENQNRSDYNTFTVNQGNGTLEEWKLNDTYININNSILLSINGSVHDTVLAELQTSDSTINITLSYDTSNNYTYNITNSDLGEDQSNATIVNITTLYFGGNNYTQNTNSTSLTFNYSTTTHSHSKDKSETFNSTADYITFKSYYNETTGNVIETQCQLIIDDTTYGFTYSSGLYKYILNASSLTPNTYSYTINCTNNSYQTKQSNGTFTIKFGVGGSSISSRSRITTTTTTIPPFNITETTLKEGIIQTFYSKKDDFIPWFNTITEDEKEVKKYIAFGIGVFFLITVPIFILSSESKSKNKKGKKYNDVIYS